MVLVGTYHVFSLCPCRRCCMVSGACVVKPKGLVATQRPTACRMLLSSCHQHAALSGVSAICRCCTDRQEQQQQRPPAAAGSAGPQQPSLQQPRPSVTYKAAAAAASWRAGAAQSSCQRQQQAYVSKEGTSKGAVTQQVSPTLRLVVSVVYGSAIVLAHK
jgi:hypothetical protein